MKKTCGFRSYIVTLLCVCLLSSNTSGVNAQLRRFSDTNNHWAYQTIQWGVQNAIVEGYPDGTFKPDKFVTEAEFLKMIIQLYKPVSFQSKGDFAHWADPYYMFATDMNYPVNGTLSTSKRNLPITRQQVANIIVGTQGVNYVGDDAVQYLLGKGLANGKGSKTIAGYDPNGTLTRGEAVQFLKNLQDSGNSVIQSRPNVPSDKTKLPPLPDQPNHDRKHEEIAKNPAQLRDVNTLMSFVRSLDGFNAYQHSVRVGSYNNVLLGAGGKGFGQRDYNIDLSYSDVHGKKVTIMIPKLGEDEKKFLIDFLKVFFPEANEKVYANAIEASKKETLGDQKTYEGKTVYFWSAGKEDLKLWVGVK